MKKFWDIVNKVINEADIILLVLDARWTNETRNKEIEDKVKKLNKPLIWVISKADLVSKYVIKNCKKQLKPCAIISAKEQYGLLKLKERIIIESKRIGKEKVTVGVLGYPNVGKSSLINLMKGKKSVRTSPISGFTKGVQKIRMSGKIMFLDTPGVLPYNEKNYLKHVTTNVIDFTKVKEPDLLVISLLEKFHGRIEKYFDVEIKKDKEKTIEEIALKKHIIKKGGKPDIERMSKAILQVWQKGVIKRAKAEN